MLTETGTEVTNMFEQTPATTLVPPPFIPEPALPVEPPPPAGTRGPSGRGRPRMATLSAVGVGGVVAGLLVGVAIGRGTVHPDPTASAQYHQLQQRFTTDEQQIGNLQTDIGAARSTAAAAVQAAQQSAAQLSQQADALASQQAALQSSQQVIAQNSIDEGTWTVGTDVAPGTYRTSAPISGDCYWGIYKSGSNLDDILQNDIVTGGYATVRLSAGQDFVNRGCGTFVKQ